MQGEPLRCFTSWTPRPVFIGQKFLPPLFEEQDTMGPGGPPGPKPGPPPPRKKIGSAAAVDPDPMAIVSPGLILDTGGAAALIGHLYAAAGIHAAQMSPPVIGSAGDISTILRRDPALRPGSAWSAGGHSHQQQSQPKSIPHSRSPSRVIKPLVIAATNPLIIGAWACPALP